jgi:hypothetical protein
MEGHYEDREQNTGEPPVHDPSCSGRGTMPIRARYLGLVGVRRPGPLRVTWPLDADEHMLREARRNLEQVGQILERMERNKAEIAQLRAETRAVLARLAA